MTGREIVDFMLDKRGWTIILGSNTPVTFDEHFRSDWAALIEAEIKRRMKGLSGRVQLLRQENSIMTRSLVSFRDDWDCDEDAHTHGTTCRSCEAADVLANLAGKRLKEGL